MFRPLNDTDTVGEDLNRSENSRATGYMGKNSDVAWMRQLDAGLSRQEKHTVSSEETRQYLLPIEPSTASMSYHLNHGHSYSTEGLDAFALPAKPLADHLFHVFLNEAHIVLPIIRKDLFIGQYQRLYTNPSKRPGKKWLAVFNLVLAIGSRFSRASRQYEQDIGDEQMFLSRAKILNYSEIYGDLQQVQAETLMAFYFLSSSQINRYVCAIYDYAYINRFHLITPQIMEDSRDCDPLSYCIRAQSRELEYQTGPDSKGSAKAALVVDILLGAYSHYHDWPSLLSWRRLLLCAANLAV